MSDDTATLEQAYARLRRIAGKLMARERIGHTLSPTDVVHEAMSRLMTSGWKPQGGDGLLNLVRDASRTMTEVLIDYSRRHNASKRGGDARRVHLEDLDDMEQSIDRLAMDWEALDAALAALRQVDERRHAVVLMRFFGGLDNRQIASELGLDERTVGRDWSAAKLWLQNRLKHVLSDDASV